MLNHILLAVALLLFFTAGTAQKVRLVGGDSPHEGRVEVHYSGSWGTVCDDYFTDVAASVVCFMIGYGRAGQFIGNRYGDGSGRIWLDNVRCSGSETSIADCSHSSWGSHDCVHSEDVSVSCLGLRLIGGRNPREGRVEVYYSGRWGTVCDDGFTDAAASVSATDTSDDLLVTSTVPAVGLFGWTTSGVVARNLTSQNVHTTAGAVTTVNTVTMFPSHVSLTRL